MSELLSARKMAAKLEGVTPEELLLDRRLPRVVRNREAFFLEAEVMEIIQERQEREFDEVTGKEVSL